MKIKNSVLPLDTDIEVWATGKGKCIKKIMTNGEWLDLKQVGGFRYEAFQVGFSAKKEY